jgi:hypothetical protein
MSNSIVVLCGKANSGKSTLLQTLFESGDIIHKGKLLKKKIKGKIVYVVGDTSSQEQTEFCKVEKVKDDIEGRLKLCEEDAAGNDFILLLPFTIKRQNNKNEKPNTKCIIKPIEWLKEKYEVKVIYLRKLDYADIMMRDIFDDEIQSVWDERERHKKELVEIIKGI